MSYGFRWTASPRALASSETLPSLPGEPGAQQQTVREEAGPFDSGSAADLAVPPRTPPFEYLDVPERAPLSVQVLERTRTITVRSEGPGPSALAVATATATASASASGADDGEADDDDDDEVGGLRISLEGGVRLDADGVVLAQDELEEPGSPDKVAEQVAAAARPGR